MKVLIHHIEEYQKGLRDLILHTEALEKKQQVQAELKSREIAFLIHEIGKGRINVFFGNQSCIDVVREINKIKLNEYTIEEDFILGTMLGYGRLQQCDRFLKRKSERAS